MAFIESRANFMEMESFGYENINVGTESVGFNKEIYSPNGHRPAKRVVVSIEGADVRLRYDGFIPTSNFGHLILAGEEFVLEGENNISREKFISVTGDMAKLTVTYERYI